MPAWSRRKLPCGRPGDWEAPACVRIWSCLTCVPTQPAWTRFSWRVCFSVRLNVSLKICGHLTCDPRFYEQGLFFLRSSEPGRAYRGSSTCERKILSMRLSCHLRECQLFFRLSSHRVMISWLQPYTSSDIGVPCATIATSAHKRQCAGSWERAVAHFVQGASSSQAG